ncbi:ABC transporter ATP-binding protein/permease [Eshraghiella crossota]|uniref:ABC transporter, ATP-binding protein n=1 Tax=Eshraghiella crossota DSM 2876 TaxID=511680 RepID=D4S1K0_9FIRM|nr:ABC transporter ATP-binding protein [Butyrivibrio crossotus]EFF67748.1 ABC transporter, ATP-binding protein [Butyrivibrio crossotus DSM 2876]UWO51504.1 ABC transporter ATP-binding protein/permease [Butyrivibrio crossotus]
MIKLLKNLPKRNWLMMLFAIGFVVLQVWLDLTIPDYMADITALVQTDGSKMADIMAAGGKMLLCAFGSLAATVVVAIISSRIASDFSAVLRAKLFNKVQGFSMEEIGRFSTASLITRSTNDVTQVQMFVTMGFQVLIKAPILAIWAVCKISAKSWQWTFSTGVAVAVLLIIVGLCVSIALPKFKKLQELTDDINRVTRENITGINVVRAYNAEKYQENKFETANNNLTKTQLFTSRTMSFMMPGIQLIMSGLPLAIYWIGAYLINKADMMSKITLFSDMVTFSSYAMQIVMAFMMMVMVFIILPRASVAAKRINEVLDTEATIEDGDKDIKDSGIRGEIEFKNVNFKYPDAEDYVLSDISFSVKKGETLAIIGATGCGKSTVINLIPRFYDVTEGEVLVDGVNVKDYKQKELRNKIGYVSQKATLFGGTVKSNIAYGDNGKDGFMESDIVDSVYVAQASEFVEKMGEGYDSYIAQGGGNLSGGQKQRLSIARAVCRHPEIFIFDDSFSALDYRTDRALRSALKKECADATKIIVAQRIGTIRDADKIIVLENGTIAGMGKHDELMKNCEVYRQIAYSQLSKEEL